MEDTLIACTTRSKTGEDTQHFKHLRAYLIYASSFLDLTQAIELRDALNLRIEEQEGRQ